MKKNGNNILSHVICHVINLFKSAAGLNLNRAVDKLIPRPTKRNRMHSENDVVLELFLPLKPCQHREGRERDKREWELRYR